MKNSGNGMSRRDFLRQAAVGTVAAAGMASGAGLAAGGGPAGPDSVKAVWDLRKAYKETTPTRERICVNGLWRWQPASGGTDAVPTSGWGYFKVPGCWPGITDYMQVESQTLYPDSSWRNQDLGAVTTAWYQREITIPREWAGRRIALYGEYLNSYATVYIDGKKAGETRFPAGEVDLTSFCQPGGRHVLSLAVVAMPLKAVMLSYSDTASAKEVKGSVERRGLCGDVYLVSTPMDARITDVKVDTSVRRSEIAVEAALAGLAAGAGYALRARITENGAAAHEFTSARFTAADLKAGRIPFTEKWKPDKLWDTYTPQNTYDLSLSLLNAAGKDLDITSPVRFGF
ncbi:MAG: sugar-binding domain-containing protein, partial [Armatimonadota bacterium]